ncbi:MAG: hypothetical protein ACTSUD_00585 [Alphaproteobacteria bacterium]
MTKLLEQAIARLRSLPDDKQEAVVGFIADLIEHNPGAYQLSKDDAAEVARRLDDSDAATVSHEDVGRFLNKRNA